MKKNLIMIALAAFCGTLSMNASPVSPEKALDAAKKIFEAQNITKAGPVTAKIVWNGEFASDGARRSASVQPAFYVIARDGGGWVMISGDDNVRPVLGISTDGYFESEDMPDNVRWWMERIKVYVRSVNTPEPEANELWARFLDTKADARKPEGDVSSKVERLTPEWGQGDPYNKFCPWDDKNGTLSVTGCAPTALAELLAYESGHMDVFPTSAEGDVGGYQVGSGYYAPAAYTLGTTYQWADLRELKTRNAVRAASQVLQDNLAHLMADLGAIVEAKYSAGGTSTTTGSITARRLIEHFYFNKAATYKSASEYTNRQWIEMLKEELDERPVFYSARNVNNTAEGHAFLLDAYGLYDGDYVFHVNFGWNGIDNGYYTITNLDTAYNGNWSYNCAAFFDFYPDADSVYPICLEAYYRNEEFPGIRAEKSSEYPGYYYLTTCILNSGNSSYQGQLKFMILKKDGTLSDIPDNIRDVTFNVSSYSWWWGYRKIDEIDFGDRFVCYYKDGEEWKLLEGPIDSSISEWPLTPAAFIDTDASYSVGDYFTFRLKNYDHLYNGTQWTICDPDGTITTISQSAKEFQLAKSGKYKIEAAVAEANGDPVTEKIVTYITVR